MTCAAILPSPCYIPCIRCDAIDILAVRKS